MKLKLFGVDFVEDTITFKIPHDIMEAATWKGGFADIDLSEISDIAKEQVNPADGEKPVRCTCHLNSSLIHERCPVHSRR